MKCISLWQPWATLIAIGAKRFDTRSWETSYRGPLLIHAEKKMNGDLLEMCSDDPFLDALDRAGAYPTPGAPVERFLPLGAIIAVANLKAIYRVAERHTNHAVLSNGSEIMGPEYAFGDYAPGRFAWKLENIRRFPEPIPFKGAQGIFSVPPELVAEQLAKAVTV